MALVATVLLQSVSNKVFFQCKISFPVRVGHYEACTGIMTSTVNEWSVLSVYWCTQCVNCYCSDGEPFIDRVPKRQPLTHLCIPKCQHGNLTWMGQLCFGLEKKNLRINIFCFKKYAQ